jgi:hypothetical protein
MILVMGRRALPPITVLIAYEEIDAKSAPLSIPDMIDQFSHGENNVSAHGRMERDETLCNFLLK